MSLVVQMKYILSLEPIYLLCFREIYLRLRTNIFVFQSKYIYVSRQIYLCFQTNTFVFHSKYICVLEPRIIFASNMCNVHIAAMAIVANIAINTLMNISESLQQSILQNILNLAVKIHWLHKYCKIIAFIPYWIFQHKDSVGNYYDKSAHENYC